ncbi:MAG: ABC transporter ATP-binding protein [Clostridia bacterium]|nr:ABC transporter ATP-binding protein [Clostridia bacterium]
MKRNRFNEDEVLETPFNLAHLKRAFQYVKRNRVLMSVSLLLSAVAAIVGLFGPKITQKALDEAVPQKDVGGLLWLAAAFFAVNALSTVLTVVRARMMAHASQNIIFDIRKDLFAHLQKLPFAYYDSRPAGKILVRVVNYVNEVSSMLSNGIVNMIIDVFNIVFITVFMFRTDARLAAVSMLALPLFILLIFILRPIQRRRGQIASNKNSNYNAFLAENIEGVRVSQLFAHQEEAIATQEKLLDACYESWMKQIYINTTVTTSSQIVQQLAFTILYIAGVYFSGGGMVSFGVLLAMGQYVGRFWQPVNNLAAIYNQFLNGLAYLERIFETMDEPVTVDDVPDAVDLPKIRGDVTFKDVTFGYEKGVPILEHLHFDVKAGESIALVGETGAGKTTVVNLISRFYNIDDGQILLDGKYDIAKVTLRSLREQQGIMMQESFIFSGTIMENIRYGKLDATDEEVITAAKAVCAHDFIMAMEKGYDTPVNERGSTLSQGQRQLIAFARTLLSDPEILILDEATSSIDTATERLLQQGIAALLKGRTSFIIAHRLSTIKNCDRIFYIADRGIKESGSHDELMAQHGAYYQLYTSQMD